MTDSELAALRELAARATKAPWRVPVANVFRVVREGPYPWEIVCDVDTADPRSGPQAAADAAFIAAAREAVPALCDALDAARAEVEAQLRLAGSTAEEMERLRSEVERLKSGGTR